MKKTADRKKERFPDGQKERRRGIFFRVSVLAAAFLLFCFVLGGCGEDGAEQSAGSPDPGAESAFSSGSAESGGAESGQAESAGGESEARESSAPEISLPDFSVPESSEPEESSVPPVTTETFTEENATLVLSSDGTFRLEQAVSLGIKNRNGDPCSLVYGYTGIFAESGGKAALTLKDGYYRGVGFRDDPELASAAAADLIESGGMEQALYDDVLQMLTGTDLPLGRVLSAEEIELLGQTPMHVALDRTEMRFSFD